jgi:hypothetical protein
MQKRLKKGRKNGRATAWRLGKKGFFYEKVAFSPPFSPEMY